jgi:hypothetical protein
VAHQGGAALAPAGRQGGAEAYRAGPVATARGAVVSYRGAAAGRGRSGGHGAGEDRSRSLEPTTGSLLPEGERPRVKVDLTTNKGFDTFTITITATRRKPKTHFTVFLLEKSGAPFGTADYIGDVTNDKRGNGVNAFKLNVQEAFAFNNATGSRT